MISSVGPKSPKIGEDVFVAPNSTVLGDVVIGAKSSIWFGAVVRGDSNSIRIGTYTNIQDVCVLHVDERNPLDIGDDVTVGHRAILHGCSIGDRVLIGMGSTVMNGASIGQDCIVGAGALVTEGAKFPPRSLILGFPAKVKRELTDAEVKAIKHSAEHYAEYAKLYMK